MNVCMVAYTFYDTDNRVRRYAEELAARGHHVDMLVLRPEGKARRSVLCGVHVHRIQSRAYDERGKWSYAWRMVVFLLRAGWWITRHHPRRRYHLLHIHNVPDFHVFAALAPRLLGVKVILDIHDILPEFACQKFGVSPTSLLTRVLRLQEKLSVRFAHHVIVANDLWRDKIIARDGIPRERCTTLLNYPRAEYFTEQANPRSNGRFSMIYPGTVSYLHGVDIAIRALAEARQQIPNLCLNIYANYGDLKYHGDLETLTRELGLEDSVQFHAPLPIEELAGVYATASLGVVPKRSGVFAGEAFSTKILEFMAANLPILASRTPIDEYYFNDEMITFFDPDDPQSMARGMVDLYQHPERREARARRAKAFVEVNTWDLKKQEYLDIVARLTGDESLRDIAQRELVAS